MSTIEDRGSFEAQVDALEETFAGVQGLSDAFEIELDAMRKSLTLTNREVGALSRSIGNGLRGAFEGLVFDGQKLSDVLRDVAASVVDAAYSASIKPVQRQVGELVAGGIEGLVTAALPHANGGAFTRGHVIPFADGGIVSGPTRFPIAGATGLMGEAGPEAILPLARGADGRLGVRAESSTPRPVQVTMNITTPDVQGFARSQSQIAAELGRLIALGQRNR